MLFKVSLYVSLIIFLIGLIYKICTWFRFKIGINADKLSTGRRIRAALKGIIATISSPKLFVLFRSFLVDVILQGRTLNQDGYRWLMHMFIFWGFMLLLLMHALGSVLTTSLFPDYQSTLNPFFFLRDFFGALVIVGLAMAICRRIKSGSPRIKSNAMDYYAIAIVAVIIVSGIALEATKIISYKSYQDMVEEYMMMPEEDELKALEAYWVQNMGLVSPNMKGPFDKDLLEMGKEVHEGNCADCHARSDSAFLGYGVSRVLKPAARVMDRMNIPLLLWYIHFLACFVGLAYLPFSKMFHLITNPISLLVNSVMDSKTADPANVVTRHIMELDACTHCSTCSTMCSVAVISEDIDNINILPSEKIISLKKLVSGRELGDTDYKNILQGIYLCSNCNRCTVVCPVGIDLQGLWFSAREELLSKGYPEFAVLTQFSYYRGLNKERIPEEFYLKPIKLIDTTISEKYAEEDSKAQTIEVDDESRRTRERLLYSEQSATFTGCYSCQTCTSVCPVVNACDKPGAELGMLPHQIVRCCAMGAKELAFGSLMLWSCTTCYKCQDECPQGVKITDVFYELKNMAILDLGEPNLPG